MKLENISLTKSNLAARLYTAMVTGGITSDDAIKYATTIVNNVSIADLGELAESIKLVVDTLNEGISGDPNDAHEAAIERLGDDECPSCGRGKFD